ncbi:heme NO-binding domain-containing protein [Roseomonas gilardii subsp. gilardii]|uniref:heme NO-binding domain-containing protein n=1 Tax=Roseomonas gilardii TaxID=257708 RepID=UPI001FFB1A78|nr:heme NO-binding domain-containing protein [Roseomonas gilardii]UPG73895.1 heme NO-binding domain-containing protein [Roseomonas gilardii subsp. gilardii]
MIGLIQSVLVDLLHERGGEALLRDTLALAELPPDTEFRIDRNYPDGEFLRLLDAATATTGLDRPMLIEAYATAFLARAKVLFPAFFTLPGGARGFLRRQAAIHVSLGAGLRSPEERQGVKDKFRIEDGEHGDLIVSYHSASQLCDFYRALAHGAAREFGEMLTLTNLRCQRRDGGAGCTFRLSFPMAAPMAAMAHG